ncbi:Oidioi.mRNA.OKI2018_I69.PAR.g8937.t1.cds [Oikopleura dioica]|uniref:Oidioi.mRNA.OKI2018_I69.PAR.g8937.t1.cds n=1 Tax=Oikopleura dioica TaxID=34765 RepID=A0ABN7RKX0_OIKDI|nr:Oidioi.mRNA.OKI2018_I69.PAR.g8937.t1.cds [Oikopleura dioica]
MTKTPKNRISQIQRNVEDVANKTLPISICGCPGPSQFSLAVVTLLFILSCVSLVYTILIVCPGMKSYYFAETNCTVMESRINGEVLCPGKGPDKTQSNSLENHHHGQMSDKCPSPSTLKCLEIVVAVEPNYGEQPYYLLHPNEYSFVTDILSCSYHPPECACNNTIINLSVDFYKLEWGRPGQQFPCFQSTENPLHVAKDRAIKTSQMVHATLWPALGISTAFIGCTIFWFFNNGKTQRLFIYNSFAQN